MAADQRVVEKKYIEGSNVSVNELDLPGLDSLDHGSVVHKNIDVNITSCERKDEVVQGIPKETGYVIVTKCAFFFPLGCDDTAEGTRVWYSFACVPKNRAGKKLYGMFEKEEEKAVAELSESGDACLAKLISKLDFESRNADNRLDGIEVLTMSVTSKGVLAPEQKVKLVQIVKSIGDKVRNAFSPLNQYEILQPLSAMRRK